MSETLAGIGSDNLLAALPPEIGELTNLTELRGTPGCDHKTGMFSRSLADRSQVTQFSLLGRYGHQI